MRRAIILALALALAAPAASSASISVFGSYWDTDDLGSSLGVGGRFGFGILPKVRVELGVSFYEDFERQVTLSDLGLDVPVQLEVTPIDAGVHLNLGLGSGLYVGAGATLFLLDSTSGSLDDEFGYFGLVGWRLGGKLFVELVYRDVEGTFESFTGDGLIPDFELTEGAAVDLTGFGVQLGFRF